MEGRIQYTSIITLCSHLHGRSLGMVRFSNMLVQEIS